jgi:carbonic anhydrase
MSATDKAIRANDVYVDNFTDGELPAPPARKLAIVACMDARLMVSEALGLRNGDAHIIRNAGGIVTEDALRSLIISHHLLGTQEVMIVNHTDCGMLNFTGSELRARLEAATGTSSEVPARFLTFTDLEAHVREQINKVKSHPWIPSEIPVRGFIYDVKTGKLNEVLAA